MRYLVLLLLLVACAQQPVAEPVEQQPVPEPQILTGIAGFIPQHWPDSTPDDWAALFPTLPEYGKAFGVYTPWDDTQSEGIPQQVKLAEQLQTQYGIEPVIALGFEPDILTQEEADAYMREHGQEFEETAVKIAETYHPKYLALGVEVNRYWERSPSGFDDFLSTYSKTYDAIKKVSPDTQVFTIFQLEYLKGAARLSGTLRDPHPELIDRFGNKLDAVGLTVYPFLEYTSVADIPDDYLAITNKPIIITETGWPSENVADVTGSEEEQTAYVAKLRTMSEHANVQVIVWSFPHDVPNYVPFDSVSLKTVDGKEKQAFSDWQAFDS